MFKVSKKIISLNHLSKSIKKMIKKSGKNILKLILLVNVMLVINFINNLWSWIVQIKR